MRMLLIASITALGFAATAEAQHAGQKSKQLTSSKSTVTTAKRSNLGGPKRHARRNYVSSPYFYSNYPNWAARAFQPKGGGQ